MTNREKAEARANEIDQIILDTVKSGRSFRVEAGAGAGKTYSLEHVIDWLDRGKKTEYLRKGQSVACITYTNAAVDVIKERLSENSFIKPSTIHTFAWNLMRQFQSALIALIESLEILPKRTRESEDIVRATEIKKVNYTLGVRYFEDGVSYLQHDDVIKLFVGMLDKPRFRMILTKKFPIILIDEYQDSFKSIMDQFVRFFIDKEVGPQIGLFGDSWQTIYGSQGACGLVENDHLVVIKKEANFRSQAVIVDALNEMRPKLPQLTASDENDGRIIIITTNGFAGHRVAKGYYKDELVDDVLFDCINNTIEKLSTLGWGSDTTKKLMLTHKMLAKEQGYADILDVLGDHFKNIDDEHLLFFRNKVEPIYEALMTNDSKKLFDALGVERRPFQNKADRQRWLKLREALSDARESTIYDVLKVIQNSMLIDPSDKIAYWIDKYEASEGKELYHGKPIASLYSIPYQQVLKALDFLKPEAEFATDHGVKGEQYENVFMVMGRGWNDYKFDQLLYVNPATLKAEKDIKAYTRVRNLFYVCCSRPEKRLAILITVPVNASFKAYLENIFGLDNIMEYTDFMKL